MPFHSSSSSSVDRVAGAGAAAAGACESGWAFFLSRLFFFFSDLLTTCFCCSSPPDWVLLRLPASSPDAADACSVFWRLLAFLGCALSPGRDGPLCSITCSHRSARFAAVTVCWFPCLLRFFEGFDAGAAPAAEPSVSTFSLSAETLRLFTGNIAAEWHPGSGGVWCAALFLLAMLALATACFPESIA